MRYELAAKNDKQALENLWHLVFKDDMQYIKNMLDNFVGEGNVYVARQDENIMAMLFAPWANIGDYRGRYFCSLATHPAARQGGVMTKLMQYAEADVIENGAMFSALIPANKQLYDFYEKRGYEQKILLRSFRLTLSWHNAPSAKLMSLTAQRLMTLRSKYIRVPYVSFGAKQYKALLQDLLDSNAQLVVSENAYAIFWDMDKEILVAELFASSSTAAEGLLRAVCAYTGKTSFRATVARDSDLFPGYGDEIGAGLVKPLHEQFTASDIYMRFGMDEII